MTAPLARDSRAPGRRALWRWWHIWLVITLLSAWAAILGQKLLYQLDGVVYDYGITSARREVPDERLAIVGLTEAFMAGRPVGLTPRDRLARLLNIAVQGHPAAIVLDVWLDAKFDDNPHGHDAQLRQALWRARVSGVPIFLAQVHPAADMSGGSRSPTSGLTAHDAALAYFTAAATGVGTVDLSPDPDGTFRNLPPTSPTAPSLPMAAAERFARAAGRPLAPTLIRRLQREETPIDFRGGPGSIPVIPATDLLRHAELAPLLTGKMVFIGATYPRSGDTFVTPFSHQADATATRAGEQRTYGVELLAQSTSTILDGARRHSAATRAAHIEVAIAALLLAGVIAALAFRGAAWGIGAALTATALAFTAAYWSAHDPSALWGWHAWPASPFLVAATLASGLSIGYRQVQGAREIKLVKEVFAGYVSDDVLHLLRGRMPATAEIRDIAVLFCDIEGYSALAEKLRDDPIALLNELNTHFEPLVAALKRRGAYTDNYVGDLVMALFGAPTSQGSLAEDTRSAVLAAVDFIRIVRARNEARRAAGQLPIDVGVGVHCGPAVTGYLGSSQRMHYTAIGDSVNIASRVESATRKFDTHLLITEEVVQACAGDGAVSSLGWEFVAETQVKGRLAPVRLYRCTSLD